MDLYPLACPWSFLTGGQGRLGSRRLEGRRKQRRWLALLVSLQCGVFSFLALDSPASPSRVKWQHSAPFSAGQRRALFFLYSQALLVCRTDFSGLDGGRSTLATTLSQVRPVVGYASAPDLFPQPVGAPSSSDPCKHNNILHHSNSRSIHSRKRVSPPLLHVTSPSPLGQESGNQVSGGSSASSSMPSACPSRRSPPPPVVPLAPGGVRWLKASELDLPDIGALIPMEKHLSPQTVALWTSSDLIRHSAPGPTPESAMLVTDDEWVAAVVRLRGSSLLTSLPLKDVAVSPLGDTLRSGVFCLVKKVNADGSVVVRLIIDRRPQNYWEYNLPGLELPHAVMFTKFILSPEKMIRLSLRDASNFYYMLKVPESRLPWQAVGPPVSQNWLESGCPLEGWTAEEIFRPLHDVLVQPCFRALAMGDGNGVITAEEWHRTVLLENSVYTPQEEILYGRDPPPGQCWAGVMIDDLATIQEISKSDFAQDRPHRDKAIMAAADEVYASVDLHEKASKRQRDLPGGKVWGRNSTKRYGQALISSSRFSLSPVFCWPLPPSSRKS